MPAGAPTRNDPTNISQLLGWGRQLENEHGPDTAKAILSEYYSQRDGLSKDVGRGLAADTLNGNVDTLETVLKDNGGGLAEEEYGAEEDVEVDCECAQGAGECECEVEHGGDDEEEAGMLKSLSFVAKADNGDFVIYGPASVDIVDKEDDVVSKDALESALPNILKRGNLSLEHTDIQPGEIVEKYETDEGKTYKTEVREVTKDDLDTFPKLKDSGAEPGDHALFLTAKLYDDTSFSKEAQEKIKKGELGAFSISGQATDEATEKNCGDFTCKLVNVIKDLDGSAVTLAEEGMCQGASFEIVNKEAPSCGCSPNCQYCGVPA